MQSYSAETGIALPADCSVHNGFLEAWRALRKPVLEEIESLLSRRVLSLQVIKGGGVGG